MIGGTAAEEAGAAIGFLLDDGAARGNGRGAERVGGTEDGNDGQTDCGGHVHGARIVTEEEMALREQGGKIGDDGFAGEIDGLTVHVGDNGVGDGRFGGGAEEDDVGVVLDEKAIGPFGETPRGPTFGGAVGCPSADGDAASMWARASIDQSLCGVVARGIGNLQRDVVDFRQGVEPARATNKFQIVELFVGRNFAGPGDGDGFSEERAAGVASVADALRNSGAPGKPCGVEGVLQ